MPGPGLRFDATPREALIGIDATPDDDYPIRVLEAYLAANRGGRWSGTPGHMQIAADELNAVHDKRADLLEHAIHVLRLGGGRSCVAFY